MKMQSIPKQSTDDKYIGVIDIYIYTSSTLSLWMPFHMCGKRLVKEPSVPWIEWRVFDSGQMLLYCPISLLCDLNLIT